MNELTFQGLVFKALLWGITYYFIRRGLNPEVEDVTKFRADAIYGSLAAFVSGVLAWYLDKYVVSPIF